MTDRNIEQQWEKLRFEILKNKPKLKWPYPPEIVRRRDLLVYAQVYFEKIMLAKQEQDEILENYYCEKYFDTMAEYYRQGILNIRIQD